jgi:hypothetical protein
MSVTLTREELVERARYLPKTLGRVMVAGWLVAVSALACLIGSLANMSKANALIIDWRISSVVLIAGVSVATWAGGIVQRQLEAAAEASGYSREDLLAIEDEAERLNEEES